MLFIYKWKYNNTFTVRVHSTDERTQYVHTWISILLLLHKMFTSQLDGESHLLSFLLIIRFFDCRNPNDEKFDGDSNPCESQPSSSRSSSNEKSSKQKVIDWPCYDRLYKKYLTIGESKKHRTEYTTLIILYITYYA